MQGCGDLCGLMYGCVWLFSLTKALIYRVGLSKIKYRCVVGLCVPVEVCVQLFRLL